MSATSEKVAAATFQVWMETLSQWFFFHKMFLQMLNSKSLVIKWNLSGH